MLPEKHRWEQRESKLSHVLMVYYVIVLSLFPRLGLRDVYARLLRAWHWLGEVLEQCLPTAGAPCYRRGGPVGCVVCRPRSAGSRPPAPPPPPPPRPLPSSAPSTPP